jgi:hypothetical protein
MQMPVTILNANTKREQGRKAQLGNIAAAKAVADIIRTTLGPRSMLKMLLDPNGSERPGHGMIEGPPEARAAPGGGRAPAQQPPTAPLGAAGRARSRAAAAPPRRAAPPAAAPPHPAPSAPGIVLTNDGHAILREIDVTHPAAKVGRGGAPRAGGGAARGPRRGQRRGLAAGGPAGG